MSFGDGGIALGPGEGKSLEVLGLPFTFKAKSADTGGAYFLTELTQAGEGPPPHTHKNEEEAIYVLEGELNVQMGESTVKGTAGCFFLIPRGTVHTQWNAGTTPAKSLLIFSPGGFGQFFEEAAGETDMDKLMAIAAKYGMEMVGPPPGQ